MFQHWVFNPQSFKPRIFYSKWFKCPGLKSSWFKSPELKRPGLKPGVENYSVENFWGLKSNYLLYLGCHRDSVHAVLAAEYSCSHDHTAMQVYFEVVVIVLCETNFYILGQ